MKYFAVFILILILSCNKEVTNPSFEKIKLSDKEILKKINDSTLRNVIGKNELITNEKTQFQLLNPYFLVFMEEKIF